VIRTNSCTPMGCGYYTVLYMLSAGIPTLQSAKLSFRTLRPLSLPLQLEFFLLLLRLGRINVYSDTVNADYGSHLLQIEACGYMQVKIQP
jgi:hypothetical protein